MADSFAASAPPLRRSFIFLYLLALMAVAAYVRVHGASVWHVSPDDINHIEMAKGATISDVLRYSLYETHPPLGQLLRHYWLQVSEAPWFMRSFALLFGLALIPLYYRIGEKLAGAWAGLATATLVAFSHGCIIQSYVVRNYTLFLLLLSLALYAAMLWRERHSTALLFLYFLTGTLATLTHFSGLFGIACIAAVEFFLLLRARAYGPLKGWVLINLLIGVIALGVMHFWQPILSLTREQVHAITGNNSTDKYYPIFVMDYLFAYRASVPYVFFLFTCVIISFMAARRILSVRPAIYLAAVSWILGSALVISGLYIASLNRNSLWLLPFILPPVGCALGWLCASLSTRLPQAAVACLLMLILDASYSEEVRYKDGNEYMITEADWQDFTHYMSGLDASHLVIVFRGDAFLLAYPGPQNLYDLYPIPDGMAPADLTAVMPYYQAKLLFKPYRFNYAPKDLLTIVREAEITGELRNTDTLVFTSTLWSNNTVRNLILCDALEKTITTFPPIDHPLTADDIQQSAAIVVEIPKWAFFDELLTPDGKGRQCIKELD